MSSAEHARPITPESFPHYHRPSFDVVPSPRSRRSFTACSPVQDRPQHALRPVASYGELGAECDVSFNAPEGSELGNLADELADAEDNSDDGDADASMLLSKAVEKKGARDMPNDYIHRDGRDDATQSAKTYTKLCPASKVNDCRNQSRHGGSDPGDESDMDCLEGISTSLETRITEIDHLAHCGSENNGSANDDVFICLMEQLRDLDSQVGVESSAARYACLAVSVRLQAYGHGADLCHRSLITAHTALTTHVTHQTRIMYSLTAPLLSPLAPPLSLEMIDDLLPLINSTITCLPSVPPTPLEALQSLSSQTQEFIDTISSLSDNLHMGRQTSNLAQRRLKVVRDAMCEWRRENELREQGIRWIEKGCWETRLTERHAASVCNDVVGGFEETCNGWRERLVAMSEVSAV